MPCFIWGTRPTQLAGTDGLVVDTGSGFGLAVFDLEAVFDLNAVFDLDTAFDLDAVFELDAIFGCDAVFGRDAVCERGLMSATPAIELLFIVYSSQQSRRDTGQGTAIGVGKVSSIAYSYGIS